MIQKDFSYTPPAFRIGDLVKPKEPNDLEAIMVENSVLIGNFVIKTLDANGNEVINPVKSDTKVNDLFGIALNSIETVRPAIVCKERFSYLPHDTAVVGRCSSKLSVVAHIIYDDGLAEENVLTAKLYCILANDAAATFNGALFVSDAETPAYEGATLLALDANKFRLRKMTTPIGVYLEIQA